MSSHAPLQLLMRALESLSSVYLRRNLPAEQWRSVQLLSIVASPQQVLYAAQVETRVKEQEHKGKGRRR